MGTKRLTGFLTICIEEDLRDRADTMDRKYILHEKTLGMLTPDFIREMRDKIFWNADKMEFIKHTFGMKFYNELFKGTKIEDEWLRGLI